MRAQRKVVLDFPDDHGASVEGVLDALPQYQALGLVGWPMGWFRLRGLAAKDRIYLLMAVSGLGVPATEPLLNPDELQVDFIARGAVEQCITNCGALGAVWTEPFGIEGAASAVAAFESLWARNVLPKF